MQTIRSKKETNYHSHNCFTRFCSSIACVIAFREKNIIWKRSTILIVEQFFYIDALVVRVLSLLLLLLLFPEGITFEDHSSVIPLCKDVSSRSENARLYYLLRTTFEQTFPFSSSFSVAKLYFLLILSKCICVYCVV